MVQYKPMKNTFITCLLIIVALLLCVPIFVPYQIDKQMNTVTHSYPYKVSNQAQELYQSLDFIGDLHSDVLLWKRDILQEHDYGHEDIPRMIKANMALQAFTLVNKSPADLNYDKNTDESDQITSLFMAQGRPLKSWFSLTERVIYQSNDLYQYSQNSKGQLSVITSQTELQTYLTKRQTDKSITAGFLGIEGAQALEGKLESIDIVFNAGIRMIGLTHFFDNELGASAHGVSHAGITKFGRQAIERMEQLNILIDLSHASPKLIDDVLTISKRPLIVSHSGVKGTCDNVRNLSDEHLKKIAATGGLIGIAMFDQAVCGNNVTDIARAIYYTANLIGVEHVALGSDFDGAIKAIIEVRGLPLIVEELIKLGMSNHDISLVMGVNMKIFLLKNLPK